MKQNVKFRKHSLNHVIPRSLGMSLTKYGHHQGFNLEETREFAYKFTLKPFQTVH
jgi:hypothetical protein